VRGSVDAHSIANTIRMSRTVRKHASALLVEGPKDVRVYRNFIDESVCDILSTEGKTNAAGALNVLRNSREAGVLVVVDSDFSRLHGQQVLDPDVITTDDHDIEAMLVKSPAPGKLLIEYDLRPDVFGPDVGAALAKAVMPLGYLRFASLKHNLNLDFKNLIFRAFVRGNPVRIDEQRLVREVLAKNPRCTHSENDLRQMMGNVANANHDYWHVGCGHDMTAALAVLLADKTGRDVPSYTIERQLRLSFHPTDVAATALFREIKAWEQRNTPYGILRNL
jgi:hypothetical protein